MTDLYSAYVVIYQQEARWKQHRAFSCREDALRELSDLNLRYPSYAFEMVYTDGRVVLAEVAPLPDNGTELVE